MLGGMARNCCGEMVVALGCTGEELSETFLPSHSMVVCCPTSIGGWLGGVVQNNFTEDKIRKNHQKV